MKVAFDGRVIADRYPGIGRYAYGLARALAPLVEMTLITDPRAENTRFNLRAISAPALAVEAMPASLAAQWRVPRAVAQSGAEVYHAPYFVMPYHQHIPSVVTFFDLTPILPEARYGAAARLAILLAHRLAAARAKGVIALSRWARDLFAARLGMKPERIAVIPPGIDAHFQPRPSAEVEEVRARLGLPADYLLYVGTQRPHKNLARLTAAYARLPHDAPPLVIAGRAEPRFGPIEAGERVCFSGSVSEADLPALYSGARLFVFPSLAEGFGLPVLEAMACGAPVACSTAPGLDEAAGDAAARFDPRNVDELATTLADLLRDPSRRAALRERGLQHAATFSWEAAARETATVYEGVVSG